MPDFIVYITCICFNMNKHSVTVQDLAIKPNWNSYFAFVEPRKVLPSLSPPCEEVEIYHSAKAQTVLVQIQRCMFLSTLLLMKDSENTKKAIEQGENGLILPHI